MCYTSNKKSWKSEKKTGKVAKTEILQKKVRPKQNPRKAKTLEKNASRGKNVDRTKRKFSYSLVKAIFFLK
jgi:hypothetical protein